MLDQYQIVDLPKVPKVIHLGELAQINPSMFVVEVDANSPDDLADMVDLFGSLQTDHYFVVVNKGINIKEVVDKAREYWAEDEKVERLDRSAKLVPISEYEAKLAECELHKKEAVEDNKIIVTATQSKDLKDIKEEELPQFGERKSEVWDAEYRAYNESRPK